MTPATAQRKCVISFVRQLASRSQRAPWMSKPFIAEYWRYKPTSALWAVRLIDGHVTAAAAPLADADLAADGDDTTVELLRYLPYTERDGRWILQNREDFMREPHHGELHGDADGDAPVRGGAR